VNVDPADPFWITDRTQIGGVLRQLSHGRQSVKISLGEAAKAPSFFTTVLAVDIIANRLTLDTGGNPLLNIAAMRSTIIGLEGDLEGVKVACVLGRATSAIFNNHPSLRFTLPDRLYYRQRRLSPRYRPPAEQPVWCDLPAPGSTTPSRAKLFDVSLHGVGLVELENMDELKAGRILAGCKIGFPQQPIDVTLEVVRVDAPQPPSRAKPRVGCRFLGLNEKTLSTLQQAVAQLSGQDAG
jgi:c-di-GMP-binding flagellar brake protein YcgR